jgi:AraC-like DNA-binding protein
MPLLRTVDTRPKGVVAPATAKQAFRLERYLPSAELAPFLDHYWLVEWDLRGRPPHVQRTLPYPCVHLVFDTGRSAIFGVPTGASDHELKDAGRVLGVRFRPGAFRGLLGRPVREIADKIIPVEQVFPWTGASAEREVLGAVDDEAMVGAAEALLRQALPEPDPQVERIAQILAMIENDVELTRVQDVAERAGMSMRALQQLFGDHVGVTPKWVIRRYRLHDAADRIAQGQAPDLAALAHALGYYDQAHFTSDFQRLIGMPPAEYRRANTGA